MPETLKDLAARLAAAHDGGPLVEAVDESLVPADLAGVYALQDLVIAGLGPVGGWKVQAGVAGDPICAPIPASRYFEDGAELDATRHRFILPEVEVAVKLAQDLAADTDAARAEAAVGSLHPALEMIADPFALRDGMADNIKLGDLQSNGAVVVGPAFDPGIKSALGSLPVSLLLDGNQAKATDTGPGWTAVIEALVFLARHAAARGMPLKAGQVIITGSRVLAPHGGAREVEGRAGEWGRVTATLRH